MPSPRTTPFADPAARFNAGRFGMRLFLVSLGILFASTVLAFVVVRVQLRPTWPVDLPPLPRLLWLSTAVLILSSVTMQSAMRGVRHDDIPLVRAALGLTLLLALIFLALQAEAWFTWLPPVSQRWSDSETFRLALAGFYVLTGLHALHIVGGIVPMAIAARRAASIDVTKMAPITSSAASGATAEGGARTAAAAGNHHLRRVVQYVGMYWHFLDAVWIALYITLLAIK